MVLGAKSSTIQGVFTEVANPLRFQVFLFFSLMFVLFFFSLFLSLSLSLFLFLFLFSFSFSLYLSFSPFGWCCLVSSFFGWCCVTPLFLRGAAWFLPSSGGAVVFPSPVWWCCLPSPPLGSGACLLSSVRRCCLVSSFLWRGVAVFPFPFGGVAFLLLL